MEQPATFDDQVLRPFMSAGATIANLEQEVKKKFRSVEHYPDKQCSHGCSICMFLKRSHHHLDVVMKLHGMMERDDQLLCFLPSQKEVIDAVQRMTELNINAKPLYAQQNGAIQMKFLRTAKVFFSTNIAETSLTFPSLRFVVDCGQVQRPRFISETALMETVPASLSTLRQRSGRVGRTMDGDSVGLFKKMSQPRQDNISPKMDLERHEDLFFSLQCLGPLGYCASPKCTTYLFLAKLEQSLAQIFADSIPGMYSKISIFPSWITMGSH